MSFQSKIKISKILNVFELKTKEPYEETNVFPGSLKQKGIDRIYWLKNIKYYNNFNVGFIIIASEDYQELLQTNKLNENLIHLTVSEKNPRLIFAQILAKFFNDEAFYRINTVKEHKKNKRIYIGDNVFIGINVTIGDGTVILNNSVINKGTSIGSNCTIKENCTIGTEGLGYEFYNNEWIKFPQIGGVTMQNNITFGPHSTIRRGALDNTIVRNGCKIGAFVNIGHNCDVGENALLTCQCVIGGSTKTGKNLFMGIQSSIRNGLKIGDDVTIGQGGIATKNFEKAKTILIGNPAEPFEDYKKWSSLRKEMLNSID